MNIAKMRGALQDLIIRLQDAEKGYKEIYNASSNPILKQWMKKYADERHDFHKDLEMESRNLGGDPEVKTSILGDLHRVFIDIKINNIDDSLDSVVDEIERGSSRLIEDYDNAIVACSEKEGLRSILEAQKWKINEEVKSLNVLKEELAGVTA
jgi:uncharacterized protein (TIGR02284 family)